MRDPIEIQAVCPSLFIWSRYAPEVKADLFSTAAVLPRGAFIVDPIAVRPDTVGDALAPVKVAGVIVTNENHVRAAVEFAQVLGTPVYAHGEIRPALHQASPVELGDGEHFGPGLTAIAIEGAPAGEIAIHSSSEGGSLVIGDALINMGSYGFTFLPAKYCRNQKQMRRSLRKLLDYDFERIAFAHGFPLVTKAKSRLATLLDSDS